MLEIDEGFLRWWYGGEPPADDRDEGPESRPDASPELLDPVARTVPVAQDEHGEAWSDGPELSALSDKRTRVLPIEPDAVQT